MLNDHQGALTLTTTSSNNLDLEDHEQEVGSPIIRDIHALTPPRAPRPPRQESWEMNSHRSSSLSAGSSEINFSTMSREFNALVLAGATVTTEHESGLSNLERIREEDNYHEDNNPLAIVPDNNHLSPTLPRGGSSGRGGGPEYSRTTSSSNVPSSNGEVSVQRVKKEEVDSKISAWQNAKIAKINNRFKREDAVINGWEGEQVQKATSWMKKIERKLDEKRAKALEKMQNDIAKARRKAEERKASAEAKRGTKVARVLEISNLMRAVGRPPAKRSFF